MEFYPFPYQAGAEMHACHGGQVIAGVPCRLIATSSSASNVFGASVASIRQPIRTFELSEDGCSRFHLRRCQASSAEARREEASDCSLCPQGPAMPSTE